MYEDEEVCCEDCGHFDDYDGWCEYDQEYVSSLTLACENFEERE